MKSRLFWNIPSSLEEVYVICADTAKMLEKRGCSSSVFTIDLLLCEFVNNAIIHGNALDHRKRVRVAVKAGKKWIMLRVSDEGNGFDWKKRLGTVAALTDTSGRGLAIGQEYAGRMRFNRRGNTVSLWVKTEGVQAK